MTTATTTLTLALAAALHDLALQNHQLVQEVAAHEARHKQSMETLQACRVDLDRTRRERDDLKPQPRGGEDYSDDRQRDKYLAEGGDPQ